MTNQTPLVEPWYFVAFDIGGRRYYYNRLDDCWLSDIEDADHFGSVDSAQVVSSRFPGSIVCPVNDP